jgi:mRNA-degrading endonuclease HigB of HigAB toxin-antitoxin module
MKKIQLAPNFGNMYVSVMLAIGISRLEAYWTLHPEAEPSLRALHALLSAASWGSAPELVRQWPAMAREDKGCVRLTLADEGCEVLIQVNFARKIAQIQAVNALLPHGATSDDRQRTTDQVPGGLRASPA